MRHIYSLLSTCYELQQLDLALSFPALVAHDAVRPGRGERDDLNRQAVRLCEGRAQVVK